MKFKNKQNKSIIEVRIVVTVVGGGVWLLTEKRHEGTFWNTGNVLYLDLVGGQMCIYTPQNLSSRAFMTCSHSCITAVSYFFKGKG